MIKTRQPTNFTPPSKEIEEGWNVTYEQGAYGHGPIQASFSPFLWLQLSEYPALKGGVVISPHLNY
jgi:hypothetical protein